MATPTFANTPTQIDPCDATTNWTANSLGTESDFYKEGLGCLGYTARLTNVTIAFNDGSTYDLSNTHIRLWWLSTIAAFLGNKSAGGVQIEVSDGTNTGAWYVSGGDEYDGGWKLLVVDTRRDVDTGTKPDMTIISDIVLRYGTLTGSPKNVDNTWIDNLCYGDGYTIYGGTSVDPVTWDDIASKDALTTEGWGLVQKINGVYFVNGQLTFGDAAGVNDLYFEDESQVVVFLDEPVYADLYGIKVVGNGTGTTSFIMGTKVGSRGISGCIVKAAGNQKWFWESIEADITNVNLYGCIFQNSGSIQLHDNISADTDFETIDCTFEDCGLVEPLYNVVKYCSFINAKLRGIRLHSPDHNVSDISLINCPRGVYIEDWYSGDWTISNFLFSNNTYDFENASCGHIDIGAAGTSNPGVSSYIITCSGGTMTITATVLLTVYVKDKNAAAIQTAQVSILKSDKSETYMNEDTDSIGKAEASFNYPGSDVNIIIRIRKSSPGDTRYIPIDTSGVINSSGFSLTAIMQVDPNV